MSDRYQDLAHNPIGKFLVKNLGLPNPPYLERYEGGPLVRGTVLTGTAKAGATSKAVTAALKAQKIDATGVPAQGKRYKGLVFETIAIAALSVSVWAHHMYVTGSVMLPFFGFMTMLIAVPTGVKFFNWIGTLWRGSITFETPMLWSMGFMITFLFGSKNDSPNA